MQALLIDQQFKVSIGNAGVSAPIFRQANSVRRTFGSASSDAGALVSLAAHVAEGRISHGFKPSNDHALQQLLLDKFTFLGGELTFERLIDQIWRCGEFQ